jgi:glycosyltransferase involved in cell wall biosynthesis
VNSYLQKHAFCERFISEPVSAETFLIVVIPCHDEPDLVTTLQSLLDCEQINSIVEVIIVINSGQNDTSLVIERNAKTLSDATKWIKNNSSAQLKFHLIDVKGLPQRHAGVGLARKIGMDEAVRRLDDINKHEGVIVCLDADCTVEKHYLIELEKHFHGNSKATGCSIYFEHSVDGNKFDREIYNGIINYELFLRYYCGGLTYCRFPYAFQTIGSCMAVRSSVYQKQGGMNRRKAGEDFYFLHKIFPLGNFTNLNTTKVIPSPRPSHRVPFGTGSTMQKILMTGNQDYSVYNVQSFIDLKNFFAVVPAFYRSEESNAIPDSIKSFLSKEDFREKLKEIREHCASEKMFVKRFFNWFDGFMVLKFMHFARDNFYPNIEVMEACRELLKLRKIEISNKILREEMLLLYRMLEREKQFIPSKPSQYSYPE